MAQAANFGTLFQRMVDISSGKAGLETEQALMSYFGVDTLHAAYLAVRGIGREDEGAIAALLDVIAPGATPPVAPPLDDVTPIHAGYTEAQLSRAFDLVRNPADWRAPINWVGPMDGDEEDLTVAAIEFYTACNVRVIRLGAQTTQIIAAGYRRGPAGP